MALSFGFLRFLCDGFGVCISSEVEEGYIYIYIFFPTYISLSDLWDMQRLHVSSSPAFLFCFFKTGFLCVALVVLELAL